MNDKFDAASQPAMLDDIYRGIREAEYMRALIQIGLFGAAVNTVPRAAGLKLPQLAISPLEEETPETSQKQFAQFTAQNLLDGRKRNISVALHATSDTNRPFELVVKISNREERYYRGDVETLDLEAALVKTYGVEQAGKIWKQYEFVGKNQAFQAAMADQVTTLYNKTIQTGETQHASFSLAGLYQSEFIHAPEAWRFEQN